MVFPTGINTCTSLVRRSVFVVARVRLHPDNNQQDRMAVSDDGFYVRKIIVMINTPVRNQLVIRAFSVC